MARGRWDGTRFCGSRYKVRRWNEGRQIAGPRRCRLTPPSPKNVQAWIQFHFPLHPGYNSGQSIKRSPLLYSDTQGVRVHDAQVLVQFVDRCMIFILSREGRSHCPEEFTESIYRKRQHFARHRVGSRELTSPVSQRVRQHSTSKGVADDDHTDSQCQHCYSS